MVILILSIKSASCCGQTRPHISKHHILKSCFCVTRFPQVIICRKNHSSRQNIEFQILFAKRYVILVNKFAYPSIFGHFPFSEIKLIVCNLGADGDGSDLSKILQRLLEKYLEVNLRNIAISTCTKNPAGISWPYGISWQCRAMSTFNGEELTGHETDTDLHDLCSIPNLSPCPPHQPEYFEWPNPM